MAETEKITINMSVVDLGKVDLLVDEGFYQNRTDFIRTAIRVQLEKHNSSIEKAVNRYSYGMGVFGCTRKELEAALAKGEKKNFDIIGMLIIENDVTPELADHVIDSIHVLGVFKAKAAIKEILKDRIR